MCKAFTVRLGVVFILICALCACKPKERDRDVAAPAHEYSRNLRDPFEPVEPGLRAKADTKTNATAADIQAALKNAGFYDGSVDGIMGKKTTQAIKAFQRAHNLTSDGKVGAKTWQILSRYVY